MTSITKGVRLPIGGEAAGSINVMGSNILTPRPPPNSARGDHAELLDMLSRLHQVQLQPRLPAVSAECSCKSTSRKVSEENAALYDSDLESDSDSSDDSDSEIYEVRIDHVLKAFSLYETRPVQSRNPSTLCNLVLGYSVSEDISDEQTQKVLLLYKHADQGLREASLLLIGQLGQREENAFKFMLHEAVPSLVDIVDSEASPAIISAAARALEKLCAHHCLEDMWAELMILRGIAVLLQRLAPQHVPSVRLSAGEVLAVLAGYHSMAMMLLDQGMDAVLMLKGLNSEAKEVYISIVTAVVLHTDHTCAEMLDAEVLPSVVNMLKLGTCGAQVRCLSFLSALCVSAIGLPALLELKVVPAILSALVDSKCRKVRCGAAECLSHLVGVQRSSFQKQVFVQVDGFYHDHEVSLGMDGTSPEGIARCAASYRTNTSARVQRGLTDLLATVVSLLEKEARMERDRFHKVVSVHLTPTVDVDPVTLMMLKHLSLTLGHMTQLKVNRPKIRKILAVELEDNQWLEAWRGLSGDANPQVCLMLVDGGALCFLDLLHTYTLRLHAVTGSVPPLPSEVTLHGQQLSKVIKAWGLEPPAASRPTSAMPISHKVFSAHEIDLISSLIGVAHMFAKCTHKHVSKDVEAELKQMMEEFKFNEINNNSKSAQVFSGTEASSDNAVSKLTSYKNNNCATDKGFDKFGGRQCDCSKIRSPPSINNGNKSAALEPGLDELERSLGVLWRLLRTDVYEAGILESVAPWLSWQEPQIQVAVLRVLSSMIQPIPETINVPHVPVHHAGRSKKNRPISAMTTKEKEHVISKALHQMSPDSSDLIKRVLGRSVSSMDPIELAKGNASRAIKDFIADLDKAGLVKGKLYDDIVSSVLAEEQEFMQKVAGRRHFEGAQCDPEGDGNPDSSILSPDQALLRQHPPKVQLPVARPLSGKSVNSRPQSAKQVGSQPHTGGYGDNAHAGPKRYTGNWPDTSSRHENIKTSPVRPQSAKSAYSISNKASSGLDPRQANEAKTCRSRPQSAKTSVPSAGSRPPSGQKPPTAINRPPTGRRASLKSTDEKTCGGSIGKPISANCAQPWSCKSSSGSCGNYATSEHNRKTAEIRALARSHSAPVARRGTSARPVSAKLLSTPHTAWSALLEHLSQQGPLPWRPTLSRDAAMTEQCQGRVADICGAQLLHTLLAKPAGVAQEAALMVEQLSRLCKSEALMKYSTHGLVPRLVDFLRVWDQQPEMLSLGLLMVRQTVVQDIRLCQLFHRHSGTALLMSMTSKQTGFLRSQVAATLKLVTSASKVSGTCSHHEGHHKCNRVSKVPDIWDRIMRRWLNEDRVMLMLRKNLEC